MADPQVLSLENTVSIGPTVAKAVHRDPSGSRMALGRKWYELEGYLIIRLAVIVKDTPRHVPLVRRQIIVCYEFLMDIPRCLLLAGARRALY